MAKADVIRLTYDAEIRDLARKLEEIPDRTSAAGRASAKEINAAIRAVEKQQKQALKASEVQQREAAKAAKASAKGIGDSWRNIRSTVAATTAAISVFTAAAIGAGSAIVSATRDVVDYRNELTDAAARTGLAASTIQTLRQAAEGSGQGLNDVSTAAQRIPKLMADAEAGLTTAVRAFGNLGVETHTASGEMRDADDVFRDVIAALGAIDSDTERAARSMDLFGRSGGKLVQALAGGAEQMEALDRFTERWGVQTTPKALQAAARTQQEIAAVGTVWRGAKDSLLDYIVQSQALEVAAGAIVGYSTTIKAFVAGVGDEITRTVGNLRTILDADSPLEMLRAASEAYGTLSNPVINTGRVLKDALIEGRKQTQLFRDDWQELMESLAAPVTSTGGEESGLEKLAGTDKERQKALADLQRIAQAAGDALLGPEEKILTLRDRQLDQIMELGKATQDWALAGAAANDVYAESEQKLIELQEKREAEAQAAAARRIEEARRVAEEQERIARKTADAELQIASYAATGMRELSELVIQNREEGSRKGEGLAKASAITDIIVSSLAAGMKAWEAYGDIPFVGPALAVAQDALIAGVAAAQIGKVASAYTGLDFSYASSTGTMVHPGEMQDSTGRIKTRTQTERSGGSPRMIAMVNIDGATIATAQAEQDRRGGPARAADDRRYGRLGRSRGYRSI